MSQPTPSYLYHFVAKFRLTFAHKSWGNMLASKRSKNKKYQRRTNYYTKLKIARKSLHVLNPAERMKLMNVFTMLLSFAQSKNPKKNYFPMDLLIQFLFKKGFHVVRFAASLDRIKDNVQTNRRFSLLFRKKNELLIIQDDFNWHPTYPRKSMKVWKITCSDEQLESTELLMDMDEARRLKLSSYDPVKENLLRKASEVSPELVLEVPHRLSNLNPKSKFYYLNQIDRALQKSNSASP